VEKIKALIITGTMHLGGIENQLMHLLRNADASRFQIDYTSTIQDAYYRSEIESLGGQYLVIPHMSHTNPFPYCKSLYRIMKNGRYDVVHSHELFHSGIVLLVASLAGVPVRIAHAHNWQEGDGTGKRKSLLRRVYNTVMRWLILSCSTHQLACSSLAGKFLYGEKCTGKDSYHLVFNSVDTAKFLDLYDQKETGEFCDGWCNVLQVGRVTCVKNQLFLTEIAAEFKRRGRKIRILCAGSGDAAYTAQVNHEITEQNLQEYMHLLGNRSDIDVLMRKANAFVLPSRYEGMPLVLIEAQASGLPCVAADTFSHEVDFETGKLRWLPLDGDAAAWADAIEDAVSAGRSDKIRVMQAVAEKRFDSRMFAETLCEIYQNAVLDRRL
jgi:glycosyltransferase EpsF